MMMRIDRNYRYLNYNTLQKVPDNRQQRTSCIYFSICLFFFPSQKHVLMPYEVAIKSVSTSTKSKREDKILWHL